MADEFVAARAKGFRKARRIDVNVRIDQHRGGRIQGVEQVDEPPGADAVAIVAPGVVQHIRLRTARREFGSEPLAECEVLEIDGDIDGESGAVGPAIFRTAADRQIVETVVAWRRAGHSEPR